MTAAHAHANAHAHGSGLRHFRLLCLGIFAGCLGMLAFAIWYLQGKLFLDPCPMCVLQRYCFAAVGIVAETQSHHADIIVMTTRGRSRARLPPKASN